MTRKKLHLDHGSCDGIFKCLGVHPDFEDCEDHLILSSIKLKST